MCVTGLLLASAITDNLVLERLNVRGCGVRDKGIAVLCDTLKECSAVTYVDFSKNSLTPVSSNHCGGESALA